ncbi:MULTISPECIES: efflux RND transporter periplasmic adaptor subunit [Bosea]|jgi:multidrug efflux system membrane fusion protein|uniref:efflux RND transporter periplasmic adaptor subunit n=1 Tax=Bosea TaxID=85413 RepID=UPI00214F76B2|nr:MULTISPECIES: efflux RND transporter periplasmic adaptor subunit [Bosea]MCR4520563.1 efflux RND transporter periplasmic adaptor subunit [Bosea sp. 47.2.35]MDR6827918.1 RND family efflux transporter MFP subunit [Bosea robiniae]MDR6894388.1 RND family efflux transporter MFP subunit [Bosea sp. BE109]MDR7138024.1 RND family efflux transporter MFP subunit [Bosea sp. BE168]MDR7174723.1 RND family efflux transporter MFP subunit [Bosea sp. BE271]
MSRSRFIGLVLTAALSSTALTAFDAAAQGAPPAPPVQVATPLAKRITNWDEFTGRFEASEQVDVRARVSGFIESVHFRDGSLVQKGDLLFTIDQRPYKLAVDVARAEVARAKAQVDLAQNEVERAEGLTQNRTITARDVDQRRANLNSAVGSLQGAEANLKNAELNLEWTEVRAPLAGRISNRRVDPGNLIAGGQSGASLLTTIVAVAPIYFTFDISEADFLRYTRMSNPREQAAKDSGAVVEVRLSDEPKWGRSGKVNFFDNALNARSATIRGRAVFENKDQFLTPGVFGRLRFFAGESDALLVPDTVIASDQANKIVLTVGPENKVVPKPVVLGPLSDGLRVIRSGLTAQDKVIIGGNANPMVRPGVPVTPQPGEIKVAATN